MSFNGYANTYPNSNVNNNFVNSSSSENIGIFPTVDTGSYLGLVGAKTGVIGANSMAAVASGVTSGNCMKGGKKHMKRKIKNLSKMYKMKRSKSQIKSLKRKIMTKYRLNRKNSKNKTKKNYKRTGGEGDKPFEDVSQSPAASGDKPFGRVSQSPAISDSRGAECPPCPPCDKNNHSPNAYDESDGRNEWLKSSHGGVKNNKMTKYRLKRKNSKNKTKKNYKRGGGNMVQSGQFQNNLPVNQSYSLGGVLDAKNSALANPPPYEVVSGKWAIMDNFNKYTGLGFSSKGH